VTAETMTAEENDVKTKEAIDQLQERWDATIEQAKARSNTQSPGGTPSV
jgi:hypothetical protein